MNLVYLRPRVCLLEVLCLPLDFLMPFGYSFSLLVYAGPYDDGSSSYRLHNMRIGLGPSTFLDLRHSFLELLPVSIFSSSPSGRAAHSIHLSSRLALLALIQRQSQARDEAGRRLEWVSREWRVG